jgi:hypothetical protein
MDCLVLGTVTRAFQADVRSVGGPSRQGCDGHAITTRCLKDIISSTCALRSWFGVLVCLSCRGMTTTIRMELGTREGLSEKTLGDRVADRCMRLPAEAGS